MASTGISASSEARDRKSPISPHKVSLQSSFIEPKIHPIRCLEPIILGLRQGQKLKRLSPMTINALAKEMVMDQTTLGRNVQPLERDGLIRIEASATDGRAKELHLTKAGEKRLVAGREAWEQAQDQFESRFGARRAASFRAMLRAVVASDFTAGLNVH